MRIAAVVLLVTLGISGAAYAEEKPLKDEEVLTLQNFELRLQNLKLQQELISREVQKVEAERSVYHRELLESYGLGEGWKINLEKGVWVNTNPPAR